VAAGSAIDHRRFKDEIYGEFARVGAALAHPRRLELLDLLAQRERSVEDVAREMELPLASASQHLRALARARLVSFRRAGTLRFYGLADASVDALVRALRRVAERQLADVRAIVGRHLGESDDRASLDEVVRRANGGDLVLLDVRPTEEFETAHIAGARSFPVDRLLAARRLPLSKRAEIVAYCRGPYCVWAHEAVEALRERGYRARVLPLGVRDAEAAGARVERQAG
jgi:rhodanese-related sulfurtransferase